jgi:hypothetical protein
MKYDVEMDLGARTYIPNFIKIGSGIQKLMQGIYRQQGDGLRLVLFFKKRK